ncbi:hypothetical protein G9F72_016930 [Clostridium estertheticum]|uniref:hypothetical protein n=1 Tax=Clostridium estertheticum TaxID=238834 RepID=UPI0013E8FFDC|nr:hypothetical protein [Clostridium estertheticum]MBZ9688018.1 hypothetical protein [Clostridium estertheticum]
MKFRRNMFLEVSAEKISAIEFSKRVILNRVNNITCGNTYQMDTPNIKDFVINIRNKNLYVLIEGETIYIKMVTLPLVKKHQINDLIKNELRYYYKDIDHISFTYKLIKKDKFNMEIMVFCLSGNNLNILESCIDNNINLKKVNTIQFCVKSYYCNEINEENYILGFYYNCILYLLICHNNEIVANTIIRVVDLLLFKFSYAMNEFLDKYNDHAKLCKTIYYSNVEGLNIEEFQYPTLPVVILRNLKRDDLVKYIIIKG